MTTPIDNTTLVPAAGSPRDFRTGYRKGFRDGRREAVHERRADASEGDGQTEGRAGNDSPQAAPKDGDDSRKPNDKPNDKPDGKAGDKPADGKTDEPGKNDKPPLYKRPLLVLVALLVLLALIIGGVIWWRHAQHHESTDDAFVDGRASAIAAQAPGRVSKLYVTDNQVVKAGDLLLDIDSRDIQARVDQANAQLANAEAELASAEAQVEGQRAASAQAAAATRQSQAQFANTRADLQRYRQVDPDAVSREQVDSVQANSIVAKAQVDASLSNERASRARTDAALAQVRTAQAGIQVAKSNVEAAALQLSYVHVVAPIDGRVTRRSVEVGNVITVGQPLLSIVQPQLWVTANYKETQLTHMQVGQKVEISVDAYPDLQFQGHVDSIQSGTGAYFSMLPAENATGNYVKVVQRVPVKIVFDDDRVSKYAIGPGMSVTPNVLIP